MKSKSLVAAATLALAVMHANAFIPIQQSATVADTDVAGTGDWSYQYTLTNTSSCGFAPEACTWAGNVGIAYGQGLAIREFDVQLFDDSDVSSITDPTGWTHTIVAGEGTNATLAWTSSSSTYDLQYSFLGSNVLSGFGFTSAYGLGKGSFSTTDYLFGTPYVGDPAIPLSPDAIAAGIQPLTSAVPEPANVSLLLAGLGALAIACRKRKVI